MINQIVFLGLPRIGEIRFSNMFCHVTDHATDSIMGACVCVGFITAKALYFFCTGGS